MASHLRAVCALLVVSALVSLTAATNCPDVSKVQSYSACMREITKCDQSCNINWCGRQDAAFGPYAYCQVGKTECKCAPSGSADPHFVGYDGSRYDFNGVSGSIFNLISTQTVHVNALFTSYADWAFAPDSTWMSAIGIKLANGLSVVAEVGKNFKQTVTVNGEKLSFAGEAPIWFKRELADGVEVLFERTVEEGDVVVVTSATMQIGISAKHTRVEEPAHLDMTVMRTSPEICAMDGVLGHTWNLPAVALTDSQAISAPKTLNDADYVVGDVDILGTSSSVSLFGKPCPQRMLARKLIDMKATVAPMSPCVGAFASRDSAAGICKSVATALRR